MIDLYVQENDWGIKNQDWHAKITCQECSGRYTAISSGRGVALAPAEQVSRLRALHGTIEATQGAFLDSTEVARLLEELAAELEALPSVAARYRLVHRLGIETATLATFRKHLRGQSMEKWLKWCFSSRQYAERLASAHVV